MAANLAASAITPSFNAPNLKNKTLGKHISNTKYCLLNSCVLTLLIVNIIYNSAENMIFVIQTTYLVSQDWPTLFPECLCRG